MATPQAALSTRLIFLKVDEDRQARGVVSRANCSVNGEPGARRVSPIVGSAAAGGISHVAFLPGIGSREFGCAGERAYGDLQQVRADIRRRLKRSGKIGASGRLLCTIVAKSLPEARILPGKPGLSNR
jgi:hypothetical protein